MLPSERTIVLERFRDEIGDWRLCVLSPYGGRVHAAWALALSARMRERFGLEADAIWSDDGIILHLPDLDADEAEALPVAPPSCCCSSPRRSRRRSSPSSAARRCSARASARTPSRALLIPRAYPGRRTPLWQQRLKAQSLLEVARRYADFPIVLETYRECLRDVLDVPGPARRCCAALHTREISLVEVETPTASPFASSLLFDYVATYMYEGDTPNAERRAAALSLDRDLLRELLGQEELRELIDPGALERVEDDLQHRSEMTRATGRDELHDVLRRVGDLTRRGGRASACSRGSTPRRCWPSCARERRAVAPARRRRGALHRRRRRRPLPRRARRGAARRAARGLPRGRARRAARARRALRAHARAVHDRGAARALRRRRRRPCCASSSAPATLVRGELRPGGQRARVVRRRGPAAPAPRLAGGAAQGDRARRPAAPGRLPARPGRASTATPRAGAGVDRLREVLVPLQGLALPAEIWERDVLPRRTGAYSPTWLDELCASGELVWVGAGALGRSGRVALYFREDAPALGPPPGGPRRGGAAAPGGPEHELLRARLRAGPCFFTDLLAELDAPAEALREALWDLVWAGEVTNDAWAPLRAPRLALARAEPGSALAPRPRALAGALALRARAGARGAQSQVQGRWSLTDAAVRRRRRGRAAAGGRASGARSPSCCSSATASSPASRCSPRASRAASRRSTTASRSLETLGVCRRGYFVEGLGGAQFALPGAVERLRASAASTSADEARDAGTLVLAAADPAQPYGAALPGPGARGASAGRRAWRAPTSCSSATSRSLYVERGGRGLLTLASSARARTPPAGSRPLEQASPTRCARRSRRSPRRCAPGAVPRSRSSGSTASRRSSRRCSGS